MKHLIFYFSGTGNCLHLARTIGDTLRPNRIQSMASPVIPDLSGEYASIGFVFPVYFQGLPRVVIKFIEVLDFSNYQCDYLYGVVTCGVLQGNALPQMDELLRRKGRKLAYSKRIKMYSNYIIHSKMSKKVDQITEKSDQQIKATVPKLASKTQRRTRRAIPASPVGSVSKPAQ